MANEQSQEAPFKSLEACLSQVFNLSSGTNCCSDDGMAGIAKLAVCNA